MPHDHTQGHDHSEQVINYMLLRRAIGVLGVSFPIWLWAWVAILEATFALEDNISTYYHTASHDWFVGILFAIGIFLWAYRGPKGEDALEANLAGGCALGVALFPTLSTVRWIQVAHTICAVGLFLVLAWFCLRLFTRGVEDPTPQKLQRNRIFVVCGWTILACIALIGTWWLLGRVDAQPDAIVRLRPVFWLETFALWAFGISWLTKGEMICPDPGPEPTA